MKQIGTDFEGWPEYKHNLKEILIALGGEEQDNGDIVFHKSNDFEIYPRTLEDDGMGYGVNEKFISEVSKGEDFINIFIEKEDEEFKK